MLLQFAGFILGSLFWTFLLSRVVLWLARPWRKDAPFIVSIHIVSLTLAALSAGYILASQGYAIGGWTALLYLPAQLVWLTYDLVRLGRKPKANDPPNGA